MKKIITLFILSLTTVLFAEDLLKNVTLAHGAKLLNENGKTILHVEIPGDTYHDCLCELSIDLKKYCGKRIEFSAMYRLKNVQKNEPSFCGAKFMLPYEIGDSKNYPESVPQREGVCSWTPVQVAIDVTENVTKARLCLGLQRACGIAEFKDLKLRTMDFFSFKLPSGFRCEYTEKARSLPVFRGVMTPGSSKMTAQDVRDLGKWNANIVRWQFNQEKNEDYDARINDDLMKLDSLLPEFKKAGIYVIWDMHSVPGGRSGQVHILGTAGSLAKNEAGAASFRLYYEKKYADHFVRTWRKIAKHYKNEPTVVAYDLMNEPTFPVLPPKYDYLELQLMAAKAIREIDPEKIIIVTSINWADPVSFIRLKPLPLKNIWYTAHMYYPGNYTHQGVGRRKIIAGKFVTYPNKEITPEVLKKILQPVRDFQLKYGAQILIGEFSAIRWAPGADRYLKDCITIFEEYRWNWIYHAFREWNGWSVEHGENPKNNKPVKTSKRKDVLLEGFSHNKKCSSKDF